MIALWFSSLECREQLNRARIVQQVLVSWAQTWVQFGSKLGFRAMNERKAFDWAVRSLRLYDWNPAAPDRPRFQVNDDSLTIQELCERVKKVDEPLTEVIKYDLYPILGRAPDLQAKLRSNETYSVAATCLLEFLTERARNLRNARS